MFVCLCLFGWWKGFQHRAAMGCSAAKQRQSSANRPTRTHTGREAAARNAARRPGPRPENAAPHERRVEVDDQPRRLGAVDLSQIGGEPAVLRRVGPEGVVRDVRGQGDEVGGAGDVPRVVEAGVGRGVGGAEAVDRRARRLRGVARHGVAVLCLVWLLLDGNMLVCCACLKEGKRGAECSIQQQ